MIADVLMRVFAWLGGLFTFFLIVTACMWLAIEFRTARLALAARRRQKRLPK